MLLKKVQQFVIRVFRSKVLDSTKTMKWRALSKSALLDMLKKYRNRWNITLFNCECPTKYQNKKFLSLSSFPLSSLYCHNMRMILRETYKQSLKSLLNYRYSAITWRDFDQTRRIPIRHAPWLIRCDGNSGRFT